MKRQFTYSAYDIFERNQSPHAIAYIKGGPLAPNLEGISLFYQLEDSVYIVTYVAGMPIVLPSGEPSGFHGFHIHQSGDCTVGDPNNPFQGSGGHYNPTDKEHPMHAGDLPPLLSNNGSKYGTSFLAVTTNRFTLRDIIGKSVIIHQNPDDFHTQPAGNSGPKWACGIIERCSK